MLAPGNPTITVSEEELALAPMDEESPRGRQSSFSISISALTPAPGTSKPKILKEKAKAPSQLYGSKPKDQKDMKSDRGSIPISPAPKAASSPAAPSLLSLDAAPLGGDENKGDSKAEIKTPTLTKPKEFEQIFEEESAAVIAMLALNELHVTIPDQPEVRLEQMKNGKWRIFGQIPHNARPFLTKEEFIDRLFLEEKPIYNFAQIMMAMPGQAQIDLQTRDFNVFQRENGDLVCIKVRNSSSFIEKFNIGSTYEAKLDFSTATLDNILQINPSHGFYPYSWPFNIHKGAVISTLDEVITAQKALDHDENAWVEQMRGLLNAVLIPTAFRELLADMQTSHAAKKHYLKICKKAQDLYLNSIGDLPTFPGYVKHAHNEVDNLITRLREVGKEKDIDPTKMDDIIKTVRSNFAALKELLQVATLPGQPEVKAEEDEVVKAEKKLTDTIARHTIRWPAKLVEKYQKQAPVQKPFLKTIATEPDLPEDQLAEQEETLEAYERILRGENGFNGTDCDCCCTIS